MVVARKGSLGSRGARLVVVVDNTVYVGGLESAWGLSIYIESRGARLLFDTGPDPGVLERNSRALGLDLGRMELVVISHGHRDHTGGLSLLTRTRPGTRVYVPAGSGLRDYVESLGAVAIEVEGVVELGRGIYVVGPLHGPPPEDALAIETERGLVLLVGCSHPGILNIARETMERLGRRVHTVIGGLHLFGSPEQEVAEVVERLLSIGVERVYPLHCSGDETKRYLMKRHPEVYGPGGAGLEIELV